MNNIIKNINQIKEFYSLLRPLAETEVGMITLAARTKYLSEENHALVGRLSKTEVMARTVIKENDIKEVLRGLYRFECNPDGFTTTLDKAIPKECLVVYVNVNPLDPIGAMFKFQEKLNLLIKENAQTVIKSGKISENYTEFLKSGSKHYLTCLQQSMSSNKENFLHLDIDYELEIEKSLLDVFDAEIIPMFKDVKENDIIKIFTRGGCHILIRKRLFKFNPESIPNIIASKVKVKEAHYTEGNLVPLPGTLQGGYMVTLQRRSL